MHCKYSKKQKDTKPAGSIAARGSDECGCKACDKKEADEANARELEKKRLQEAMVRKNEVENEQLQKRLKAEREKNKSTEVVIVSKPAPVTVVNKPEKDKSQKGYRFMLGNYYNFINTDSNNKILSPPQQLTSERPVVNTFGPRRLEGKSIAAFLHPEGIGVIEYGNHRDARYCNVRAPLKNYEIVDYDWNPFFNDENIHYIEHFYENWFLIGYLPCEKYEERFSNLFLSEIKLYNVKTRKFYTVEINGPFHKLNLPDYPTKKAYNPAQGFKIFRNPIFYTGEPGEDGFKHRSYEFYFDKITGRNDSWKAAVPIYVQMSSKVTDFYLMVFIMDKSGNFKLLQGNYQDYRTYSDM